MKARYEREIVFRQALQKLYPKMPPADVLTGAQRHARHAAPDKHALYVAACAVARHCYTEYETLCPKEATEAAKEHARIITRPAVRAKLREWAGPDRDPG